MFAYKKKNGELERKLIFRTGNEDFKKVVEEVSSEMKCVKVEDLGEWQKWDDPTSSLSRKLFDKKIKASLWWGTKCENYKSILVFVVVEGRANSYTARQYFICLLLLLRFFYVFFRLFLPYFLTFIFRHVPFPLRLLLVDFHRFSLLRTLEPDWFCHTRCCPLFLKVYFPLFLSIFQVSRELSI